MPRRDFERIEIELNRLEKELTDRLCAELRQVSAGFGTLFFFTREYNPHNFPHHYLSKSSEELIQIARETIKLRELLAMPTNQCIGREFEVACVESADLGNPHRLGPKRLAARLLTQILNLSQSAP